ncbi:hypothetical protein [Nocardia sp. Marseille-Q1738]
MAEHDARRTAARVFQRLTRRGVIKADKTVVCLESDSLGQVLEIMGDHFPEGGHMAIYYPDEHVFRFMTWRANDPTAPEGLEAHVDTTVGMAVAAALAANDRRWTDRIRQRVSTTEIERELASA